MLSGDKGAEAGKDYIPVGSGITTTVITGDKNIIITGDNNTVIIKN